MIEPVVYKKTLEGKSNAHLITFSDGNDYVVKYIQPGFEKTLANEWVAYCLARYLQLPIPFARIVEIPHEFSSNVPELARMTYTQHQFASLYVPECKDGHQVVSVDSMTNHRPLAGTILFDYWLCNRDRTRKNIILCQKTENVYQIWIIDHAEIFGSYNWTQSDLAVLPAELMKSATHQLMAQFVQDEHEFYEELEVIQTLPTHLIEEIVSLLPDDWNISKEERKAMVSTLVTRRKYVLPELMNKFIKKIYRPLYSSPE